MTNENLPAFQTQDDAAGVSSFTLEGKTLSGRRSQYMISAEMQRQPGIRVYRGTELKSKADVIVKEYYSFWWTVADIQRIEAELEQLETIDFRSGGVQDFRLLTPQDVFASVKDQRCYLVVYPPQLPSRSLRCQLESQGSFSPATVRSLLSQVLQTLWFLHGQMIDFADGETQKGAAHGNLNLDSVLIATDATAWTDQFQVYLQDLELWEAVVRPIDRSVPKSLKRQKQQDLQALGTIAAQLLLGELNPPEIWHPIEHPGWKEVADQPLKQFVQDLMEVETPRFSSAKSARSQLLSLPIENEATLSDENTQASIDVESIELGQADRLPLYFKIAFALTICGLIVNLGLLWTRGEPMKMQKPAINKTNQMKQ